MRPFVVAIMAGIAGIGLLRLFYVAVRLEWPGNYVTATRPYGLVINRSVKRYLLFILLPVYLASLLTSTLARREGASALLVALIVGLGHSFANHGLPMFRAVGFHVRRLWDPGIMLQVALAIGSLAASALGALGPGPFGFIVPTVDEFFTAAWTALFVTILGIVALNATRYRRSPDHLYAIAEAEAPWHLREYAEKRAAELGADKALVIAVMYAEILQRPAWFRRLEYIKGRVFPKGSYGIMQVSADKPIGDEESIDQAISRYLSNVHTGASGSHQTLDEPTLRKVLSNYNDNSGFVELATGFYWFLR